MKHALKPEGLNVIQSNGAAPEWMEYEVDALRGGRADAPGPHRLGRLVLPLQLFADLVQPPVDAEAVLRHSRAARPAPAEVEADRAPTLRPRGRSPVPRGVARPDAAAEIEAAE